MHDSLRVDTHVGFLEGTDALSAPMTERKEREGIARELLEERIVVTP